MALTDKLTAIAHAIRGKTVNVAKLTLDEMATEVEKLEIVGGNINLIKPPFIHANKTSGGAVDWTDNGNGTISIKGTKFETAAWCDWYFVNKIYETGVLYFSLKRRSQDTGYIIEVYNKSDEKIDQHWMYNGENKTIDTSVYEDYSYILYKVFITRVGEHDDLVRPICICENTGDGSFEDALLAGTLTSYSNDRLTKIRANAFSNLENLVSVSLPALTELNDSAFYMCKRLVDVHLPSVTRLKANCFLSCSSLVSLKLPSITRLDIYALRSFNLKALVLSASTICTLSDTRALEDCYHILGTVNQTYNPNGDKDGYIYVPDELVDSYKTATNWSVYASQIKPLSEYVEE